MFKARNPQPESNLIEFIGGSGYDSPERYSFDPRLSTKCASVVPLPRFPR
jgi:hypothetical protein